MAKSKKPRHFDGHRLVIASHNPGKVREIGDLLAPFDVEAVAANLLGLPEPEETGWSFRANAELKALVATRHAGIPALADDSGMSVDVLDGAPGIFSARWAGPTKDFAMAMERVWREVMAKSSGGRPQTRAHFHCALSLAWPDAHVETFEGVISGDLVWPPRGHQGFGYDPMFKPDPLPRKIFGLTSFLGWTFPPLRSSLTFGEMDPAAKHAISHRALAFNQLIDACFRKQ